MTYCRETRDKKNAVRVRVNVQMPLSQAECRISKEKSVSKSRISILLIQTSNVHMGVAPGPASQDAVIKCIYASPGIQCILPFPSIGKVSPSLSGELVIKVMQYICAWLPWMLRGFWRPFWLWNLLKSWGNGGPQAIRSKGHEEHTKVVKVTNPNGIWAIKILTGTAMPFSLKGQCHEISYLWFFSSNNFSWPQ